MIQLGLQFRQVGRRISAPVSGTVMVGHLGWLMFRLVTGTFVKHDCVSVTAETDGRRSFYTCLRVGERPAPLKTRFKLVSASGRVLRRV